MSSGLTLYAACAKREFAMKNAFLSAVAIAALLPVAACNTQAKKAAVANAAEAANEAAAANLAAADPLPPAIRGDKSFRCKDNSLAFVTFFEGDTQAVVKDTADGTPTVLKAAKTGDPLTAEGGWSMTGDEKGISLTRPGKPAVSCHV